MTLIYRAQNYHFAPIAHRPVRPAAINWRYQVAGEVAEAEPRMTPCAVLNPAAVNWRYQAPVMA